MPHDHWTRGILIALVHLLLPFLCERRSLELLHQNGDVTITCIGCGRVRPLLHNN